MTTRKTAATLAISAGLLATLLPLTPAHAAPSRTLAVALFENGTRLGRFDVANPSGMTAIGGIVSGLGDDDFLVGIDRRPQDGRLYGIGNEGGVFRLAGSRATRVGELSVTLVAATKYDIDFNPAANALRIVSSDGAQNLRLPFAGNDEPADTTETDTPLTFATADGTPGAGPVGDGITAVAYTNNDLTTTTNSTMFDIDSNLDQLVLQVPANSGLLSPVGKLGAGAGVDSGLDVYSDLSGGSTSAAVSNTAYAAVPLGTTYRFTKVDLLTGRLSNVGTFSKRVTDIAVDMDGPLM